MVVFGSALFWVLVSSAMLVSLTFIVQVIRNWRLNKILSEPVHPAQNQVIYTAAQLDELRRILAETGYAYDFQQGIFYSVMNPWQRKFGYCYLYDESSAALGMVIDCEPVLFDYEGKHWMIELWKGQYGLTVGAEIGIYNTTGPNLDVPGVFNGTFYHCARDDETLSMKYTLRRNKKVLFSRAARHWWLTGFVLGEYAKPSSLTMEAAITFGARNMKTAFLDALYEMGYSDKEVRHSGNTVMILFSKPHAKQPLTRRGLIGWVALRQDKRAVGRYRRLVKGAGNIIEIFNTLKTKAPVLYALALNMGKKKEIFKQYEKIQAFVDKD